MKDCTMSERNFFDLRYIYPGFTFILGFILAFPTSLLVLFGESTTSAEIFLAIITFIGISSFGMLISQVWHNIFNYLLRGWAEKESLGYIFGEKLFVSTKDANKMYKVSNAKEIKTVYKLVVRDFFDFYVLMKDMKNDSIRDYLSRRWDLLCSFGAGLASYILGFFMGYIINGSVNVTINTETESIIFAIFKQQNYCIAISLISLIIIVLHIKTLIWINKERHIMLKALINELEISEEQIERAFPDIKFDCVSKANN